MKLQNLTIAKRLGLGFGLVAMLLAVVIALGLSSMRDIQGRMEEITKVNDVETRLAQAMDLTVTERALAMRPDDWSVLYNAACFYSQSGEHERALDLLERALGHGGGYLDWIRHDTDLDPLRGLARFQALLANLHDRDDAN